MNFKNRMNETYDKITLDVIKGYKIGSNWDVPNADLFASRQNYQLKSFVPWCADPEAHATNAFCLHWKVNYMYIILPLSTVSFKGYIKTRVKHN